MNRRYEIIAMWIFFPINDHIQIKAYHVVKRRYYSSVLQWSDDPSCFYNKDSELVKQQQNMTMGHTTYTIPIETPVCGS